MQSSAGIAHVTLLSFALTSSPAAALPPCPAGGMPQPPGKALALKNAAQDLRDSEEWAKAAQSFRYAADELPTCDDFDDERLRWSLWAVEAFDRSASTAVVISTAVTATLGGVLAITGLALHLRRRPGKRPASAMTMGPTFGGLFVQGHF